MGMSRDVASSPFKCHFMATQYFEEILLDFKKKKEKNRKSS